MRDSMEDWTGKKMEESTTALSGAAAIETLTSRGWSIVSCVMDSENLEAGYGLQVALENGGDVGADVVDGSAGESAVTETASANGKIENVVKEVPNVKFASNGLKIAKEKGPNVYVQSKQMKV